MIPCEEYSYSGKVLFYVHMHYNGPKNKGH